MRLEDINIGALVECIKTEKPLIGNTFKIIEKLPDNKWKLTTVLCARGAIKNSLKYRYTEIVFSEQTLQNNFKIDKQYVSRRPKGEKV